MDTSLLVPGARLPLLVRPGTRSTDLADFVRENGDALDRLLLEHGAILFRNFSVRDVADFSSFINATGLRQLDYIYRSSPRSAVQDKIFTASEYPPGQDIPLHNETSYQLNWPLKVAFCCLTPASQGGETPLADVRRVTRAIGTPLFERFAAHGVRYVRHYRPYVDLPWQTVFQTEHRDRLPGICEALGLNFEWLDQQTLRTVQVAQGAARHPKTDEILFFNQAHLFHVSSLGSAAARSLIETFGADRLPRQASYGNGEEIALEDLDAVRTAYATHAVTFAWQSGDILLLDNMQVAHGRRPFSGSRRVIAALLDPSSNGPARLRERITDTRAGCL